MTSIFDDFGMGDYDSDRLKDYTRDQLIDYSDKFSAARNTVYGESGFNEETPEIDRVNYGIFSTELRLINEERAKRGDRGDTFTPVVNEGKIEKERGTTFTPVVNDGGKTVATGKSDHVKAPSSIFATFKRDATNSKKGNIKRILGMDHRFRVGDGESSKELIRNSRLQ